MRRSRLVTCFERCMSLAQRELYTALVAISTRFLARVIPFSRLIAHSSNSSKVISAVGGTV